MLRSLDSSSCLGPMWLLVVGRTTCSSHRCACRASVHRGRDYAARLRAATVPQRMGTCSQSRRLDAQDRRQARLNLHSSDSCRNHRDYDMCKPIIRLPLYVVTDGNLDSEQRRETRNACNYFVKTREGREWKSHKPKGSDTTARGTSVVFVGCSCL